MSTAASARLALQFLLVSAAASAMLVKLLPGVNFTNILRAAFSYKSFFCAAFMCLQFGFVNFRQKDFGTKAAHKKLGK